MAATSRPSMEEYYMQVAWMVSRRANCRKRRVGAIVVIRHNIVLANTNVPSAAIASAGYNGTPYHVKNCDEGGCTRCASETPQQEGYDWCVCVHAEQNAIALMARHGMSSLGAAMYVTLRPCILCLKEAIQAGITTIHFDVDSPYNDGEKENAYQQ
jgi:dCMP deaminase